jgi:hypothetical protein
MRLLGLGLGLGLGWGWGWGWGSIYFLIVLKIFSAELRNSFKADDDWMMLEIYRCPSWKSLKPLSFLGYFYFLLVSDPSRTILPLSSMVSSPFSTFLLSYDSISLTFLVLLREGCSTGVCCLDGKSLPTLFLPELTLSLERSSLLPPWLRLTRILELLLREEDYLGWGVGSG